MDHSSISSGGGQYNQSSSINIRNSVIADEALCKPERGLARFLARRGLLGAGRREGSFFPQNSLVPEQTDAVYFP
jgi:hypothetical protein